MQQRYTAELHYFSEAAVNAKCVFAYRDTVLRRLHYFMHCSLTSLTDGANYRLKYVITALAHAIHLLHIIGQRHSTV